MIEQIEARGILKGFNDRFRLECSLSLEAGCVHVLIGPNGSGKSTLMRILSLIERPDSGTLIYRGKRQYVDPFSEIELRRRVVLVNTRPVVFRESVLENVLYGLKIRKVSRREALRRAEHALKRVGLYEMRNESATGLSSGEKQRLSLARAIAVEPDVLMLDEPTVNLDPENIGVIEQVILSLKKPERIILFVTHNLFQARKLADQVIFISNGTILEQSSKDRFFVSPETEEARRFIRGELY